LSRVAFPPDYHYYYFFI